MRYLERSAAFVITAILSLVVLLILSVGLWAAPPAEFTISRDQLVAGDHLRDWTYLHNLEGGAAGAVTLAPAKGGQEVGTLPMWDECKPPSVDDEKNYRNGFCIPATLAAGDYRVRLNGRDLGLTITVRRATVRAVVYLYPGNDNAKTIKQFANATTEIVLAPGLWRFTERIDLPADTMLTGYGVTFQWTWPEHWDGTIYHLNPMLWGDRCTFAGITFDLARGGMMTWNPIGAETVFYKCRFEDGETGAMNLFNSVFMACKFKRASASYVGGGTWLDCEWEGMNLRQVAGMQCFAGHRLCVLHCRFTDVARGVYLDSVWGPQLRGYFSNLSFSRLSWVDNGCELIGSHSPVSAPGISYGMFYRIRGYNNAGQINFWEGHVRKCRFIDGELHGSAFIFDGATTAGMSVGSDQSDNRIERWQLDGGGLQFGPGSKRNSITQLYVTAPAPTRANQFSFDHKANDPSKLYGVMAVRPTGYDPATDPDANTLTNCTVTGMPAEGKPTLNVKVVATGR